MQGLFNVDKYKTEILKDLHKTIPHEEIFRRLQDVVDTILKRSKYNKVDLGGIFSFMDTYWTNINS